MVITNYYRQCGNGKFPQSWEPRMRIFNTIIVLLLIKKFASVLESA